MSDNQFPNFAPTQEPGWAFALSIAQPITADNNKELINFNIPTGQQLINIPFAVNKLSANLCHMGINVINTVDSSPFVITGEVMNFSTSGMVVLLNGTVSTANYYIRTLVFVVGQ